jgi:predicted RNase H-like nuclease (RuvC/YqgF family)
MNMSFAGLSQIDSKENKSKPKQLDKLDKVYSEMKNKNKKLKKEKEAMKGENETLRSIFAEF